MGAGGKTHLRRKTFNVPSRRWPIAKSKAGRFCAEENNLSGASDGADAESDGVESGADVNGAETSAEPSGAGDGADVESDGVEPGAGVNGIETGAELSGADTSNSLDVDGAGDHSDRLRRSSRPGTERASVGHTESKSALHGLRRSHDHQKTTGKRSRQCGRVTITG